MPITAIIVGVILAALLTVIGILEYRNRNYRDISTLKLNTGRQTINQYRDNQHELGESLRECRRASKEMLDCIVWLHAGPRVQAAKFADILEDKNIEMAMDYYRRMRIKAKTEETKAAQKAEETREEAAMKIWLSQLSQPLDDGVDPAKIWCGMPPGVLEHYRSQVPGPTHTTVTSNLVTIQGEVVC